MTEVSFRKIIWKKGTPTPTGYFWKKVCYNKNYGV